MDVKPIQEFAHEKEVKFHKQHFRSIDIAAKLLEQEMASVHDRNLYT